MVVNLPSPLPDQTIERWATLIWLRNGWANWASASKAMFGSAQVKVDSPWHGGFAPFLRFLNGAAYNELSGLKEAHGYLPLLKPFLHPSSYASVLASETATRPRCIAQGPLGGLIKRTANYCPACVSDELDRHGFAFMHRAHQILGVAICAQHEARLLTVASPSNDQLVERGVLPQQCEESWQFQSEQDDCNVTEGMRRYAAFAAAAMHQQLPATSVWERLEVFAERLGINPKVSASCQLGASLLASRVQVMFPHAILRELNAEFLLELDAHIPGVLMGNSAWAQSATINLLVIATLFTDPDDFSSSVRRHQEKSLSAAEDLNIERSLPPPFGLIRDLLRVQPIKNIQTKYGVSQGNVITFLESRAAINVRRQARLQDAAQKKAIAEASRFFSRSGKRELWEFAKMRRNEHWLATSSPISTPQRPAETSSLSVQARTAC